MFYRAPNSAGRYRALMVDQGFCFNNSNWNFPDSPLRGLYPRLVVYECVTGWDSFEPWLTLLREMDWRVAEEFAGRIPPAWYDAEDEALQQLMETLDRRRRRLPELLEAVRRSSKNPFPNWRLQLAADNRR